MSTWWWKLRYAFLLYDGYGWERGWKWRTCWGIADATVRCADAVGMVLDTPDEEFKLRCGE